MKPSDAAKPRQIDWGFIVFSLLCLIAAQIPWLLGALAVAGVVPKSWVQPWYGNAFVVLALPYAVAICAIVLFLRYRPSSRQK